MNKLTADQILLFCGLVCAASPLFAGAPLATDDAESLPQGSWEVTLAYEGEERDAGDGASAPSLELEYGFTDTIKGGVSIGRAVVDEPGSSSKSDFDAIGFEFKWQFYSQDGLEIATGAGYSFPLTSSSKDRGIVDDINVFELPLAASYENGNWAFDISFAYEIPSEGDKAVFAGTAAKYSLTDTLQLLGEVYKTNVSGAREDESGWSVGIDWQFRDELALLAAIGGELSSNYADSADELDQTLFIGFRYETE